MGRLMDSVMAAIGLKPSDRVVLTQHPGSEAKQSPPQGKTSASPDSIAHSSSTDKSTFSPKDAQNADPSKSDSPSGQVTQSLAAETEMLAVPLEDPSQTVKDCMSCRIIGTAAAYGLTGYVLWSGKQGMVKYTGRTRTAYILQCVSLSSIFAVIGTARMLDLGFFNPDKKDFTIKDHFHQDLKDFFKLINVEVPLSIKMQIIKEQEEQKQLKEMEGKSNDASEGNSSS